MARRRDIDRLTELEELFADLWQVPRFAAGARLVHRPQIDVVRTDDPPELTVVVEIPGADADSIRIVLDERRLVIAGERPRPRAADQVWYRSEIEYGPFEREVSLARRRGREPRLGDLRTRVAASRPARRRARARRPRG